MKKFTSKLVICLLFNAFMLFQNRAIVQTALTINGSFASITVSDATLNPITKNNN